MNVGGCKIKMQCQKKEVLVLTVMVNVTPFDAFYF